MKEIYDLAEQYHNDGNNCVESVVKACNDGLKLGRDTGWNGRNSPHGNGTC